MAVSEVVATVGPWAAVALVALVVLLLGFIVVMVRSAKTNMIVRIGKIIEIRRGTCDTDPPINKPRPQRRLQSVDKPPSERESPAQSDDGYPHSTAR